MEGLKKAPYDFIANHYWEIDKTELKDIILELICLVDDLDDRAEDDYREELVNNLIYMKNWNEDEE